MKRLFFTVVGVWLAASIGATAAPQIAHAQTSNKGTMSVVKVVNTGGMPDSIVVEHNEETNDVIFFDLDDMQLRFLDGDTLTLAPQSLPMPTFGFETWMAYDRLHSQTYVLRLINKTSPDNWTEASFAVVSGRQIRSTFSVNGAFNTGSAVDTYYVVQGLVLKQPQEEGEQFGRLIVDNASRGLVDIVDLDEEGLHAAWVQRHIYRGDGEPIRSIRTLRGSSLALESKHETLAQDDLTADDLLYIADQNERLPSGVFRQGYIHVLRISHPAEDLAVTSLPDIDLTKTFPYGNGINGGLSMAGPRDQLYLASGWQSFGAGYVGLVTTTGQPLLQSIEISLGNEGPVLVDWYDPKRAFVAAQDGFWPNFDPQHSLHLHLLYDGAVVDSLRLFDDYQEGSLRGMAFDPYARRLYLAVGAQLIVIDVNYGAGPAPPPGAPQSIGSTTLQSPWYGGTLETSDKLIRLDFGYKSVSTETTVTCKEIDASSTGRQVIAYAFDLTAQTTAGDELNQFDRAAGLTYDFAGQSLRGAMAETLAVYRWDGAQWVKVPTSQVDTTQSKVTATLDLTGRYAVMGDTRPLHLPCLYGQ